uniref:Uncharacterized protein n=1 Tax=Rhizophora mucronata TaxID=61149 RepID=A0A2P2LQ28_RHIMU
MESSKQMYNFMNEVVHFLLPSYGQL